MKNRVFFLVCFVVAWETLGRSLLAALFPAAPLPVSVFDDLFARLLALVDLGL